VTRAVGLGIAILLVLVAVRATTRFSGPDRTVPRPTSPSTTFTTNDHTHNDPITTT
jgi:hypothetical protein